MKQGWRDLRAASARLAIRKHRPTWQKNKSYCYRQFNLSVVILPNRSLSLFCYFNCGLTVYAYLFFFNDYFPGAANLILFLVAGYFIGCQITRLVRIIF
jgi:hypothetical protein